MTRLVPYVELLELTQDERVRQRIAEIRPMLEEAKAAGAGAEMPRNFASLAPPRFLHELIERLDRCEGG